MISPNLPCKKRAFCRGGFGRSKESKYHLVTCGSLNCPDLVHDSNEGVTLPDEGFVLTFWISEMCCDEEIMLIYFGTTVPPFVCQKKHGTLAAFKDWFLKLPPNQSPHFPPFLLAKKGN